MNATSAGRSPASLPPVEELLILAVDDTPANLVALERVLGGAGARVVRAGSGEARRQARSNAACRTGHEDHTVAQAEQLAGFQVLKHSTRLLG